jgi:hypothetical protein
LSPPFAEISVVSAPCNSPCELAQNPFSPSPPPPF